MARRFDGVLHVDTNRARLETPDGVRTLIPFPREAVDARVDISKKEMEAMGTRLFGYLRGQSVRIEGDLEGVVVFNARIAKNRQPVEDVTLAPEGRDKFTREIHDHFHKNASGIARKLNQAGIRSVSALYHRIQDDPRMEIPAFSRYLGVAGDRIRDFLRKLRSDPSSGALVSASPRRPVFRGIDLQAFKDVKGVPVKKKAPELPPPLPKSARTPHLPSSVDLRKYVTKVKDQGPRGTCVAHAALAALEAAATRKGLASVARLDLSEQYVYWAAKQIDGSPSDEGTFIEYAAEVLVNGVPKKSFPGGTCHEKQWPYNKLPMVHNESQDPPPGKVKKAVAKRWSRALGFGVLKHSSIQALKSALAAGECVAISVYTYHFWTDDFGWREGVISLPLGIKPDGAHAICLVGYKDDDATHGDGYFIFKNSWDVTWGFARTDPGYGSLPYRYVIKEAIEAFTFKVT
jgi:hypothetical protein